MFLIFISIDSRYTYYGDISIIAMRMAGTSVGRWTIAESLTRLADGELLKTIIDKAKQFHETTNRVHGDMHIGNVCCNSENIVKFIDLERSVKCSDLLDLGSDMHKTLVLIDTLQLMRGFFEKGVGKIMLTDNSGKMRRNHYTVWTIFERELRPLWQIIESEFIKNKCEDLFSLHSRESGGQEECQEYVDSMIYRLKTWREIVDLECFSFKKKEGEETTGYKFLKFILRNRS